jgi:hypothetical protein
MSTNTFAYEEGSQARLDNKSRKLNPYVWNEIPLAFIEWETGWLNRNHLMTCNNQECITCNYPTT